MATTIQLAKASTLPPVGATLIKTGQTISYRTGDDGDLEAGRATSFLVLASNNPFGNTNRFTDELGGQTYTNNIVIDWSTFDGTTVLGVCRTASGNVSWNTAIDASVALSIGSFTSGWRLWNVVEMLNFSNFTTLPFNSFGYSPLLMDIAAFWTSNTDPENSLNAMRNAYSGVPSLGFLDKTAAQKRVSVRTFTVTGTTLS